MKPIVKMLSLLLALLLLLTACGKEEPQKEVEEEVPQIDYNDFITSVVDRAVADCITEEEMSTILGYPMHLSGTGGDSEARYASESGTSHLTLTLENMEEKDFEAMVADEAMWSPQYNLSVTAYWNVDQSEMIAYCNGYAVSVAGYSETDSYFADGIHRIMQALLNNLQK